MWNSSCRLYIAAFHQRGSRRSYGPWQFPLVFRLYCNVYTLRDTVLWYCIQKSNKKKKQKNVWVIFLICVVVICDAYPSQFQKIWDVFIVPESTSRKETIIWIMHLAGWGEAFQNHLSPLSIFQSQWWQHRDISLWVWLLNCTGWWWSIWAFSNESSKGAAVTWTSKVPACPRDWVSARFCTSGLMKTTETQFCGSDLVKLWLLYGSH